MRFRTNLNLIKVNPAQKAALDDFVRQSIEEAARIWVRAALAIIPTWSGASRATLQALADAVNEHVSIDLSQTAPDRIALGRLYSSGGIRKEGIGNYELFYETTLRYLIVNETQKVAPRTFGLRGSLIDPTPYQFREAGNRAVQEYIRLIKDVPLLPLKTNKI